MTKHLLSAVLVLGLGIGTCSADLVINQYSPQRNDRFYSGPNPAFIGQGLDFSGVGKTGTNTITNDLTNWAILISPHFALTVKHANASGTVTFYPSNDPNSTPVQATVSNTYNIANPDNSQSELQLVRFGTVVGSTITPFSIFEDNQLALQGRNIFVYGQANRLGTNNIDRFVYQTQVAGEQPAYSFEYDYNPTPSRPNEARLNGNDSGGPSFVVTNNQLALVGLHTYVDADPIGPTNPVQYSGDIYVSRYLPAIEAKIAALDATFGYSDRVSVVPEPGSLGLILAGGLGLLGYARRVRRRRTAE